MYFPNLHKYQKHFVFITNETVNNSVRLPHQKTNASISTCTCFVLLASMEAVNILNIRLSCKHGKCKYPMHGNANSSPD